MEVSHLDQHQKNMEVRTTQCVVLTSMLFPLPSPSPQRLRQILERMDNEMRNLPGYGSVALERKGGVHAAGAGDVVPRIVQGSGEGLKPALTLHTLNNPVEKRRVATAGATIRGDVLLPPQGGGIGARGGGADRSGTRTTRGLGHFVYKDGLPQQLITPSLIPPFVRIFIILFPLTTDQDSSSRDEACLRMYP